MGHFIVSGNKDDNDDNGNDDVVNRDNVDDVSDKDLTGEFGGDDNNELADGADDAMIVFDIVKSISPKLERGIFVTTVLFKCLWTVDLSWCSCVTIGLPVSN